MLEAEPIDHCGLTTIRGAETTLTLRNLCCQYHSDEGRYCCGYYETRV